MGALFCGNMQNRALQIFMQIKEIATFDLMCLQHIKYDFLIVLRV